ncbi:YetF domain-containing protein [Pontibacter virosus]|uniref:YetF domain-containing protein n=1 Tax=Pontibacter virosus TaxID=1765052 RepID=UPI0010579906|nr:YetF domain-containing protein [Pontibacter virosus]
MVESKALLDGGKAAANTAYDIRATLVLLHKLMAVISFHSDFGFGGSFKDEHVKLVDNGKLNPEAIKEQSITEDDLREAMRTSGNEGDLEDIQLAFLERSGNISIIMISIIMKREEN